MKKRRNDKGFTLVELIVVLVILAILAAILVPALLGYIDKAREKQVTTNAEAAYVAAQARATEYYGKHPTIVIDDRNAFVSAIGVQTLTDIQEGFSIKVWFASDTVADGKQTCIIKGFEYKETESKSVAVWDSKDGTWTVYPEGGKNSDGNAYAANANNPSTSPVESEAPAK